MSDGPAQPARDAAAIRIYPPLVPIGAILLGTALGKVWPVDLGLASFATTLARVGGVMIVFAAAAALWAFWIMQRSGQNPDPRAPTPQIVDQGPFRFTRNPIYLQMVLLCLGFAIRKANVWTLLLTPIAVWMLQQWVIVPEEAYLERKFGEEYLSYKRRVRRWL